jgi:DNA-binding LacI/PurR family transcriptional regulator
LRYRVFCEELAAQGMRAYPSLVRDGNFLLESGQAAMASLLEQPSELDAVVAANDCMALGALEALNSPAPRGAGRAIFRVRRSPSIQFTGSRP